MAIVLLHEILRQRAGTSPDATAVVCLGRQLTYAELDRQSETLAAYLFRSGTGIGDRVAIFLNKSLESIISVFGILKTGAAYVPIDPQMPSARARYVIEKCQIRTIISSWQNYSKLFADKLEELSEDLLVILIDGGGPVPLPAGARGRAASFAGILEEDAAKAGLCPIADVNPAYILFTSGSTGLPKGVVISHANAMAFVNMAAGYFALGSKDRFAGQAPIHFDLSVFDIYVSMMQGAALHLVPEYLSAFPARLADFIAEQKISVWNSSASVLAMLADKGRMERGRFLDMRLVHFSGDVMPIKYLRKLRESMPNAEFFNIYGQTEANSSLSFHVGAIPEDDCAVLPIGRPFPNFEVFLRAEDGRILNETGDEGELYVKASTVALGYWGDSVQTNEKFIMDPRCEDSRVRVYRTGDVVRIGKDGNYYFVGRKDHMIKSRGHRIELAEIDQALRSHPLVSSAAAVAVPDLLIGNRIVAFIEAKEGARIQTGVLEAFCQNLLPRFMVPEIFELLPSLPMTSTGKIDRRVLSDLAASNYRAAK
jgi:amino acid adenylation domain-containing protein